MSEDKILRVFSYGGGVQSNAVLVLQAQGKLPEPYDAFLFANVGDDSENPATLAFVENIAKPFAEEFNIPFIEVRKVLRTGQVDTLYQFIYRTARSVPIPARMSNGAPGNRTCTADFKITIVDRWIRQQKVARAITGLGISLDEFQRMGDTNWYSQHSGKKLGFEKKREYPLIEMRLTRNDCRAIIQSAAMPMPPKSSCWFCPFKKASEWNQMQQSDPALFQKAVELEQHINEKRNAISRDRVFLHPRLIPLSEIANNPQPTLFDLDELDSCESGYCMT